MKTFPGSDGLQNVFLLLRLALGGWSGCGCTGRHSLHLPVVLSHPLRHFSEYTFLPVPTSLFTLYQLNQLHSHFHLYCGAGFMGACLHFPVVLSQPYLHCSSSTWFPHDLSILTLYHLNHFHWHFHSYCGVGGFGEKMIVLTHCPFLQTWP